MSRHLSPSECAEQLKVTGEFIRGEIRDGRLDALVYVKGKRHLYRIDPEAWQAYKDRYWRRSAGNGAQPDH